MSLYGRAGEFDGGLVIYGVAVIGIVVQSVGELMSTKHVV